MGTLARKGRQDIVVDDTVEVGTLAVGVGFGWGTAGHMGSTEGDTRNPLFVDPRRVHLVNLGVTRVVGLLVLEGTAAAAAGIVGTDSVDGYCSCNLHCHPSILKTRVVYASAGISLHLTIYHLLIWEIFERNFSILRKRVFQDLFFQCRLLRDMITRQ